MSSAPPPASGRIESAIIALRGNRLQKRLFIAYTDAPLLAPLGGLSYHREDGARSGWGQGRRQALYRMALDKMLDILMDNLRYIATIVLQELAQISDT